MNCKRAQIASSNILGESNFGMQSFVYLGLAWVLELYTSAELT